MKISQSFDKLINENSDKLVIQPIWGFFEDLQHVISNILKNKIDKPSFSVCLLKLNYIWVIKHFQNFNLSHGCPFYHLILVWVFELFHCNNIHILIATDWFSFCDVRVIAFTLQDKPIGTFSYFFNYLIFLHL